MTTWHVTFTPARPIRAGWKWLVEADSSVVWWGYRESFADAVSAGFECLRGTLVSAALGEKEETG